MVEKDKNEEIKPDEEGNEEVRNEKKIYAENLLKILFFIRKTARGMQIQRDLAKRSLFRCSSSREYWRRVKIQCRLSIW
jgi:hypothetical protein